MQGKKILSVTVCEGVVKMVLSENVVCIILVMMVISVFSMLAWNQIFGPLMALRVTGWPIVNLGLGL